MLTRQISLERGLTTRAANITEDQHIQQALKELEIPHPNPVIVLVGGAGRMRWWDIFPMRRAVRIVARLAEGTRSVVVDGGTQAGVMKEIGKQRKHQAFSFPLVGVVVDDLISQRQPGSILDSNHTHFFLVPGKDWGDESAWISKIATAIAGDKRSMTILVNGGSMSKTDVDYSLLENRPTFTMRGTGRMADEIALGGNIFAVDISQKPEKILEVLKSKLL
jgi:hypothetical protein